MVTDMAASVQSWRPPSSDSYKLNFDAVVFEDTGSSGFGVIIRNYKGEFMATLSAKGPVVSDSEEAKALARRRALEFTVDARFEELVVQGDNAMVIKSISSLRALQSRLGNVYADIHCLVAGSKLSFGCVKRTANTVVHSLARFARLIDENIVWMEESPPPAMEALYLDSISLNE